MRSKYEILEKRRNKQQKKVVELSFKKARRKKRDKKEIQTCLNEKESSMSREKDVCLFHPQTHCLQPFLCWHHLTLKKEGSPCLMVPVVSACCSFPADNRLKRERGLLLFSEAYYILNFQNLAHIAVHTNLLSFKLSFSEYYGGILFTITNYF